MNEGAIVALGALVSAIIGAVVVLINARHKNFLEREAAGQAEYRAIVDRLSQRIAWLEEHVNDQQDVITLLHAEHADCQVQIAELHGWVDRFHDMAARHADSLRRLEVDPGPVPDPPPRRVQSPTMEHRTRTAGQNTMLIEAMKKMQEHSNSDIKIKPGSSAFKKVPPSDPVS